MSKKDLDWIWMDKAITVVIPTLNEENGIAFLLGHKHEMLTEYVGTGSRYGIDACINTAY